jgi:hypothetical protein
MTKQRLNQKQEQIKVKLAHARKQFDFWTNAEVDFLERSKDYIGGPDVGAYYTRKAKQAGSTRWQWCKEIQRLKQLLKESGYIPQVQ